MKKALLTFGIVMVAALAVRADTIADWTFETSQPATAGPITPEVGAGSGLGNHAGAAVYSSPSGNGSVHSWSANLWAVGDYWQFSVNTTTFSNLQLSWDQAGSSTGPKDFRLAYSSDGGSTFTDFSTYTVILSGFSTGSTNTAATHSFDLSGVTALNNNANVVFRLIDNSTNAIGGSTAGVGTGGTDRVDNFTVTATAAVPEPSVIGMVALGTALVVGAIRHRKGKA